MHILILYLVLNSCGTKKFTQFLMYFLSIKNFKHLHEKVLERDMHARMQNSYARGGPWEIWLAIAQAVQNSQF